MVRRISITLANNHQLGANMLAVKRDETNTLRQRRYSRHIENIHMEMRNIIIPKRLTRVTITKEEQANLSKLMRYLRSQ